MVTVFSYDYRLCEKLIILNVYYFPVESSEVELKDPGPEWRCSYQAPLIGSACYFPNRLWPVLWKLSEGQLVCYWDHEATKIMIRSYAKILELIHNTPAHRACPRGVLMRTHTLEEDVWTVSYMMEKERNVLLGCGGFIGSGAYYIVYALMCVCV